MFVIPNAVMSQFDSVLKSREIPIAQYADYKKWLRFFQDFSTKYPVPDSKAEQVRLFIEKLREKKQTEAQCDMAAHAVSLYFEMQKPEANKPESADSAARQQCKDLRGRVESRFHPTLPHQTGRAVFPHPAFRCSSLQSMRFLPTRCRRHFV